MYRRQQEHAWIADLVEHIEAAVEETGSAAGPSSPRRSAFWTWWASRG